MSEVTPTDWCVHPDAVIIGERDREDLGDLSDLKASIEAVGLLHPIVITADNHLIAGGRRLAAMRELGWIRIPFTVAELDTVAELLRAEADENTCRKPLSPYEASKARQRRARVLSEDAKSRQRQAGEEHGRGQIASSNLDEANATARATRKVAAIGTGYSGTTLDKVDKVVQIAEQGTVTVGKGKGRKHKPVPEPVREIARQHVTGLKQTGAAVDAADKAVEHALTEFVEADPDVQAARYRHEISKAFLTVRRSLLTLDAARVAELLEDLAQLAQLQDDINAWCTSVGAALRDTDMTPLRKGRQT